MFPPRRLPIPFPNTAFPTLYPTSLPMAPETERPTDFTTLLSARLLPFLFFSSSRTRSSSAMRFSSSSLSLIPFLSSISYAESRSTVSSYFMARSELFFAFSFSSGLISPRKDCGGKIITFSTVMGFPSSVRQETRASPVPRFSRTSSVSKEGFSRKLSATAFSFFLSSGV